MRADNIVKIIIACCCVVSSLCLDAMRTSTVVGIVQNHVKPKNCEIVEEGAAKQVRQVFDGNAGLGDIDDDFDTQKILAGTAQINIKGRDYPVCVNLPMKNRLNAEMSQETQTVTSLLKNKWNLYKGRSVSDKVYNIHFILRETSKGYAVDVRPTAKVR